MLLSQVPHPPEELITYPLEHSVHYCEESKHAVQLVGQVVQIPLTKDFPAIHLVHVV